ncbi:SDR family oxidoreductase [Halolamina sp.]|jgi:3-oxoacyl-[acyl-carrier protein] reductase|uniref:SDR family oxidoreductase n=1 Tax=Halolamina sp. TaxID=1940283 RepID=UPI003569485D
MTRQQTAIVTGGARGIGRATAERFAADDDYDIVALFDVDESVQDVAEEIEGGVGYQVDVADQAAVFEAVEDLEESHEARIEAAINNAGISRYFWIEDLEPSEWKHVLDVNLKGQYNVARAVTPGMYRRGSGAMVNISSGAGTRGSVSGGVHYSASKGGVLGLSRGLAKQLSPHVRVNCVIPGLIQTSIGEADDEEAGLWTESGIETMLGLVLLRRYGEPSEVANVIHFLCTEDASYVTGSEVTVNGGSHLMPTQDFLMPEQATKPAADAGPPTGKTAALVTGGGRGIGKATAERFAADDAHNVVAILDIDDVAHETAAELDGGVGFQVDVSDHDAVQEVVAEIEADADLTAVVNNAAITEYYWIEDLEPDRWDHVLDVNLTGQYNVARWATPPMFRRGTGTVVNVSSGAGTKGSVSGGVHYSASKGGVLGLNRGLAKQLSPHVRVNCVIPGAIETTIGQRGNDEGLFTEEGIETMRKLTPMQRAGQPDEVASVIHYLCSDDTSFVTGGEWNVNGGSHLMPTQRFLMPEQSLKPESAGDVSESGTRGR